MTDAAEGGPGRAAHRARLVRPPVDGPRARSGGWPHPFRAEPWDEMSASYSAWVGQLPEVAHVVAIIESVRDSGARDALGGFLSMHDLVVRPLPPVEPPYDVVAVRSHGSVRLVKPGTVVVEHLSTTGHDDRIERPVADAVPLFWRFVIEKFGIHPR